MRTRLIVLLCVLAAVAGSALAGVQSAVAEDPPTTTGETTVPTTTEEAGPPPADMPLALFRERRSAKVHHVNAIRYEKGRRPNVRPRHPAREIRPWRRSEVLAGWRARIDRQKSWPRVGVYGHRWRWYEGHPERGWGFYERATKLVAVVWGSGAKSWTISCSRSEGHGMMVWNGGYFDPYLRYGHGPGPGGASTAYGPMQFMESTLYSNVDGAFSVARHNGVPGLPRRYKDWNSNIGQALAAGYMWSKGGTSAWTGANC